MLQFWSARHGAIGVHNLHDHCSGCTTRHPREVNARFSVTRPSQHAAGFCYQREYVTGLTNVGGTRVFGNRL